MLLRAQWMGRETLWLVLAVLACCLHARSADKYTDENRPYEFGFTIDGEQHRHEKKDENGLIMGEFGFITADGVYHVTVYATDENGNFKILSMKNIRVKPYPTAATPQPRAIQFPPAQPPSQPRPAPAIPVPSPVKSCSHCSIPTTPAPQLTDLAVISRDDQQFPPYPNLQNTRGRQFVPGENSPAQPNIIQLPPKDDDQQNTPGQYAQQPGQLGQQPGLFSQQPGQFGQQPGQFGQQPGQFAQQPGQFSQQPDQFGQQPGQFEQPHQINPQTGGQQQPDIPEQSDYELDSRFGQPEQAPVKPALISAQMRVVDSDTDINRLGPGEREGLPSGLNQDDMLELLYTFNYTVGFHGHHEEGYTNGVKKGYYFVTGRNGVRTRIDYVADSEGFHPKISNEVLDLLSEDVPKPETEKDERYGLKGYEFKWIYFPLKAQR